ncbi:MAG TPA: hypothetical protein VFW45_14995 [Candidatus Polarisedimenticolia bacterium]|nr:hypothetical protein [Candidatus Polarisedimenticolia bacterium]
MRKNFLVSTTVLIVTGIFCAMSQAASPTSFMYLLSDFTGVIPYSDVKLHADRAHDEIYAILGNTIRTFNAAGMEIYSFTIDPALGTVYDLVVEEDGGLLLLVLDLQPGEPLRWFILRCDYRGRPQAELPLTGLPPELVSFRPNAMFLETDRLLLVAKADLEVVSFDRGGRFRERIDLAARCKVADFRRAGHEIAGFDVAENGDLLFTVPTLFRAFVVPRQGEFRSFGHPGSTSGSFGVVDGIVADDQGGALVADKNRGVVMRFDRNLEFVAEFGDAGEGPALLIRPAELAFGSHSTLYVTQARDRGVAVFRLEPPAEAGGTAATP